MIMAVLLTAGNACGGFDDIPQLGLRIAPGFEISLFADHALAPDVYSMTLNPSGDVVISSRGYIKRLTDENGDGRADGAVLIAESKAGAMGMLFVDRTTLLTSEGGSFNRYRDPDGDGIFDPKPERIAQFRGGEHGLHAIRKDAKGRVFLIGGNDANFKGHADIANGGSGWIEGGALVRYSAELKDPVVLCHGFRNPYDFDFDSKGGIYTYDSDCEREFLLPWYTPTRLYRVQAGAHHGWRLPGWKRGWKRPDYYLDSVKPMVNVGRGSPTGVAVYRHTAFPPEYRDAVFYCDWTFGRVYFTRSDVDLEELSVPVAEIFIESTGTAGFAPTDIEVAPDGSIFISVGGRGTTGSVYHVRAKDPVPGSRPIPVGEVVHDGLEGALPVPRGVLGILQDHGGIVDGFNAEAVQFVAGELDRMILKEPLEKRMNFVRLLMRALGDWNLSKPSREAFAGYELSSNEIFGQDHAELLGLCRNSPRALLHALDPDERREAARLSAMLRDPHPISAGRMLDAITRDTPPQDDFHYLCCLACIASPLNDEEIVRVADAILALDRKTGGMQMRSKQTYIDRLNEVIARIAERAPIYEVLCQRAELARPNHAGIAAAFPEPFLSRASGIFFTAVESIPEAGWSQDVIGLFADMDARDSAPVLRRLAGQPGLRDECVKLLARAPQEIDRHLLLSASTSPRAEVSTIALKGLGKLAPKADADHLIALFGFSVKDVSLPLIGRVAGQEFTNRAAAERWLMAAHPDVALAVGIGEGHQQTDWPGFFRKVDWSTGNVARGRELFALRACAACHQSASALGPDLSGVTKRFSPVDLFTAIAMPDADVPPAYRVSVFTMKDGSRHIGRIAFTSADGVIIRTGTATTVRLDESDIAAQKDWAGSLMPKGLLAGLDLLQLADLYSYLKTL